jgi:hypothetical protein
MHVCSGGTPLWIDRRASKWQYWQSIDSSVACT